MRSEVSGCHGGEVPGPHHRAGGADPRSRRGLRRQDHPATVRRRSHGDLHSSRTGLAQSVGVPNFDQSLITTEVMLAQTMTGHVRTPARHDKTPGSPLQHLRPRIPGLRRAMCHADHYRAGRSGRPRGVLTGLPAAAGPSGEAAGRVGGGAPQPHQDLPRGHQRTTPAAGIESPGTGGPGLADPHRGTDRFPGSPRVMAAGPGGSGAGKAGTGVPSGRLRPRRWRQEEVS